MYSTYNEGISVVAERFIRTLKNKIFKHMTAISRNVYFDGLDDIVNKSNNAICRNIKMKPIDVTSNSNAEYNEDSNKKDPKFKVGGHVRISKYKNVFAKGCTSNCLEEVFAVSKIDKLNKLINCTSNGKSMIIHLIVGLIKKASYKNESILS